MSWTAYERCRVNIHQRARIMHGWPSQWTWPKLEDQKISPFYAHQNGQRPIGKVAPDVRGRASPSKSLQSASAVRNTARIGGAHIRIRVDHVSEQVD